MTQTSESFFFRQPGNLYQNPELYDFVMNAPNNEREFYLNEIISLGSDVLELACGTGRLILDIMSTNPNIQCDGLDLSESMLIHARMKANNLKIKTQFHQASMSTFNIKKSYDLIFVTLSSFLYLHEMEQFQNCFACVNQHLKENGKFIFSIFNPSLKILSLDPQQRYEIKRFINPENGKEVLIEQSSNYDQKNQINYATHFYSYNDQKDFFSHPVQLRIIFPQELQNLVKLCGFQIEALYGDYQKNIFTKNSGMQIVVCKPAKYLHPG